MPRIYENAKINFSNFEEFKEVASKTLNEVYGRVRPLDVIDFSQDEATYKAVGYYDGEVIPEETPIGELLSEDQLAAEQLARDSAEANLAQAEQELADEKARVGSLFENKQPVSYEDLVLANTLGLTLPEEIAEQLEAGVKKGHFSYEAAHAAGLVTVDGVPTLEAAKIARSAPVVNVPTQSEIDAKIDAEIDAKEVAEQNKRAAFGAIEIDGVTASKEAIALAEANGVDLSKIVGTGSTGNIKKSDVADYILNNAPVTENADDNGEQQSDA